MSGTDYTTTPNLGLYKPISNRAIGTWGDLWNSNADALDAALATGAGGAFLPLAGGTMLGPLNYTATGGTTSRAAQDRAHDWINVKDFGAKLDGTTSDTAAIQAAYAAAPANGSIVLPSGGWSAPGLALTRTGNVLWHLDGNAFGTSTTPVQYIGDGDVVESFYGRKAFSKQVINSSNIFATVEVDLDNKTPAGAGGVAAALRVGAQSYPTAGAFTWALNTVLHSGATGGANNQDVAIASTVVRTGACATWQYFGQTIDSTGLPPNSVSAIVGTEQDISCNGPEVATTAWAPSSGQRTIANYVFSAYSPPVWQAAHVYAVGASIQPTTSNGFTYVCTVAGTSGATQPTWPTSTGTVTDGTVTWQYGTTIATQISRAIGMSTAANTQLGAGIFASGTYYDAVIEMSGATLVDGGAKDAGIRLAADMPIDFSGNLSDATQNQHTLRYRSSTGRFYYTVGGVDMWSVDASGNVRARGTVTGSTTP